MARKSLVVGIGNPLLGPDGFGPAVVARLRRHAVLPPDVELLDAYTDLLGYIDRFAAFERVVLVDAVLGDGTGTVQVFDEAALVQWTEESPGSHQVSPMLAIGLFRRLYPEARTAIVLVGWDVERLSSTAVVPDQAIADAVSSILSLTAA